MASKVKRIYLAGDDDQAIYKWNGADPKYFTQFFPGRKVKLRRTQRFGEAIHRFSQVIRRGISDVLNCYRFFDDLVFSIVFIVN